MTQIGTIGTGIAGTAAAGETAAAKHKAALEKAAKGFEAIFVRSLMKTMRESKLDDGGIFDSSAVDQFQEMSDARMADSMSQNDGFGIAQLVLQQLDKGGK